jgi:hypothetical protein
MTSNPEPIVQQLQHEFQNLLADVTGPEARSQTAYTVELTLFRRLLAPGAALLRWFLVTRAAGHPAETVPHTLLIDLDHRRRADLYRRLGRVAEIGDQDGDVFPNQQQGGGAGEACQVSDIGKMGDQQPVQTLSPQDNSQGSLPLGPPVRRHATGPSAPGGPEGSFAGRSR